MMQLSNLPNEVKVIYRDILRNDKIIDSVVFDENENYYFYLVLAKGESPQQIILNLKNIIGTFDKKVFFSFIHQIEYKENGEINIDSLKKNKAISISTIDEMEISLSQNKYFSEVVLTLENIKPQDERLNFDQCLQNFTSPFNWKGTNKEVIKKHSDNQKPKSLAFSDGGEIKSEFLSSATFQEALIKLKAENSKGIYFIHHKSESFISYSDLYKASQKILNNLHEIGVSKGDILILQIQSPEYFIKIFWACLLGGIIPAPVSCPESYDTENAATQKLRNVLNLCVGAKLVSDLPDKLILFMQRNEFSNQVLSVEKLSKENNNFHLPVLKSNDAAIMLFTSGSTGMPKGVLLNHRNLLSMSAGTIQANSLHTKDISLNWMPLDHVGALVFLGCLPVDLGCSQIHVPTAIILQDPLRWLSLIDQFRATISWAPNFAFSLINDKENEIKTGNWCLSSMRFLVNAGEQISEKIARKFLSILGQHLLPPDCIVPAFGMTETCSGISWSKQFHLKNNNAVNNAVGLGLPIPGAQYRIVNESNEVLSEGEIGRFQLKGESVFSGYYKQPELNQSRFTSDLWFDTGDSGFLLDGHLYLTGRSKDDIILNGINYFAIDIEHAIDELGLTEISYTAALPVRMLPNDSEKLCIILVLKNSREDFSRTLIRKFNDHLFESMGIMADFILPMNKQSIPKTNIGKIQKTILRQNFEAGQYFEMTKNWYKDIEYYTVVEKSILHPNWVNRSLNAKSNSSNQNIARIVVGLNDEIEQWLSISKQFGLHIIKHDLLKNIEKDSYSSLNLNDESHILEYLKTIDQKVYSRDLIVCVSSDLDDNERLIQMLLKQQSIWSEWIRDIKLLVCGDIKDFEGKVSYFANQLRKLSRRNRCSILLINDLYKVNMEQLINELFNSQDPIVNLINEKRLVLNWLPKSKVNNLDSKSVISFKKLKSVVISGDSLLLMKEFLNYCKCNEVQCYFLNVFDSVNIPDGFLPLEGNTIAEQIQSAKKISNYGETNLYIHFSIFSPFYLFSDVAELIGDKFESIKLTSFHFGFDSILENANKQKNLRYFYLSSNFEESFLQRDLAELFYFIENNWTQASSVKKMEAIQFGQIQTDNNLSYEIKVNYVSKDGLEISEDQIAILTNELERKFLNKITFKFYNELPKNYIGKIDYIQLIGQKNNLKVGGAKVVSLVKEISAVWSEVLNRKDIALDATFFELGGHSLLIAKTQSLLQKVLQRSVSVVELFKYPTVNEFANYIAGSDLVNSEEKNFGKKRASNRQSFHKDEAKTAIAVIGLACRYPGANSPEEFWENLVGSRESITFFTENEAKAAGVHQNWYNRPQYVFASPVIANPDLFDAAFFGISAREAELMDPQQRVAIEVAWETFERAGYNPRNFKGSVGVYAGAGMNTYLLNNILPNRNHLFSHQSLDVINLESLGGFQVMVANDKDYIATRIAYCLDLKGPAVNVQTACSTTLVSIHMACQSLLNGETDMALTGGVSIKVPQMSGYSHSEGMIVSSDGHCRAYDEKADGTIFGNGCGFALLKRLDEALRDGDHIHAVIKGTSLNNDGGTKIGFTAPSETGEASAITEAIAISGVDASLIGYVEGHGTGTELGDPIEVSSLTQAFREFTNRSGYCALGSVKSNVGHLQIASGIVGFMKTALVVENGLIPATLHYEKPNPKINFSDSPFYVNSKPIEWPLKANRRIAGVNSLGIGGANTHAILEDVNDYRLKYNRNTTNEALSLLTISGKDNKALEENLRNLYRFVQNKSELDYRDICYTLNIGREHFENRFSAVIGNNNNLLEVLKTGILSSENKSISKKFQKIAFLFSGQGSQYQGMAKDLYENCQPFKNDFDLCSNIYQNVYGDSLTSYLFDGHESELSETNITQPLLFALEVCIAKFLIRLGVKPALMMGHSLGEYVAACVANVFSIEDGMRLVIARSRLMADLQNAGGMLSIMATFNEVKDLINKHQVWISAINGNRAIVIGGAIAELKNIEMILNEKKIVTKLLKVSQPFHTPLMKPMLNEFRNYLDDVRFHMPEIEMVSNVTGEVLANEFSTAEYWLDHILAPVQFEKSVHTLISNEVDCIIEIGPQATLLGLIKASIDKPNFSMFSVLRKNVNDIYNFYNLLSELFCGGCKIDFSLLHKDHIRNRVILPSYAFQRKSYWIDAPTLNNEIESNNSRLSSNADCENILGRLTVSKFLRTSIFDSVYSPRHIQYLVEHKVFDQIVVPGAGHISMFIEAFKKLGIYKMVEFGNIVFRKALVVGANSNIPVQFNIKEENGNSKFSLVSEYQNELSIYVEGELNSKPSASKDFDLAYAKATINSEIPVTQFYEGFARRKIELGSSFRCVEKLWASNGNVLAKLRLPEKNISEDVHWEIAPGVMDSCIQILMASLDLNLEETLVPFSIEKFQFNLGHQAIEYWSCFNLIEVSADGMVSGNVTITDEAGSIICVISNFKVRRIKQVDIQKSFKSNNLTIASNDWSAYDLTDIKISEPFGKDYLLICNDDFDYQFIKDKLESNGNHIFALIFSDHEDYASKDNVYIVKNNAESLNKYINHLAKQQIFFNECILIVNESKNNSINENVLYEFGNQLILALQSLLRSTVLKNEASVRFITCDAKIISNKVFEGQLAALVSAFNNVFNREYSLYHGYSIHYDNLATMQKRLYRDITLVTNESQFLVYEHQAFVPRLNNVSTSNIKIEAIDTNIAWLIIGASSGLGLKAAEMLADEGVNEIYLIGRSKINDEIKSIQQKFSKKLVHIKYESIDVSNHQVLEEYFFRVIGQSKQLGVIHCAGVLEDTMIDKLNTNSFSKSFDPKVKGLFNLLNCVEKFHINLFNLICFSSVSAVFGMPSQTNYGMANRVMDSLIHERRAKGLSGVSINWGPWSEIGMASRLSEKDKSFWNQRGIEFINLEQGIRTLKSILQFGLNCPPQILVGLFNFEKLSLSLPHTIMNALQTPKVIPQNNDILGDLSKLNSSEQFEKISQYILLEVGKVLGIKGHADIDLQKGLMDLGLDSLAAVDLKTRLESNLKINLKATLAFDYPTLKGLIEYIANKVIKFDVSEIKDTEIRSSDRLNIESADEDIAAALERELDSLKDQ